MRLPYLILAASLLALPVSAAGRSVERTYETTSVPCGAQTWCAGGELFFTPVGDNSLDAGLVTETPRAGESLLDVRDVSGLGVIALVCQDLDGNGGCDTTVGSPDAVRWACGGDVSAFALAARAVHVLVPPAGARISACPAAQTPTVTGSIVLTFS